MTLQRIRHQGLVLVLLLLISTSMAAQTVDRSVKVDTLKLADRISLRTNAVDWTLLLPNIGVEFDLRSTNWSRWAIGLTLRDNWQTSHTFKPGIVYNMAEARIDFRNYIRPRQVDNRITPHKHIWDKLLSARRRNVKHPSFVFYRGAYISYTSFSFLFGREGHQGSALTAGFTWGFIRPLYTFSSGRSLDLDMGFSAGFTYYKADKYRHDRESNCYPVVEQGRWKFMPYPVLTEARIGLVYRLGKYPSTKKYRWRYDVDLDFSNRKDSIIDKRRQDAEDRRNNDSLSRKIYDEYWTVYDSIARINAEKAQKLRVKNAGRVELDDAESKAAQKTDSKAARRKNGNDSTATAPTDSVAIKPKDAQTAAQPGDSVAVKTDSTAVQKPDTVNAAGAKPAESEKQPTDAKPAGTKKPAEQKPEADNKATQPAATNGEVRKEAADEK